MTAECLRCCREIARLAIGALDLEPTIGRQRSENLAALGRESEKDEEVRLAVALGYAAHVTHHLAGYLDVPLKYPIRPANSRSAVQDHQLPVCLLSQGYAFSHQFTVGVLGRYG